MQIKLVVSLLFLNRLLAYDEIETQLHRLWKHTSAQLDTRNPCLKRSMAYENEKAEDAFLTDFVFSVPSGYCQRGSAYCGGLSVPRLKATAILAKAALVLPVMGDFAETGLNAGSSAAIMMRMLILHDQCDRKFWGFDSFAGLPNATTEDGVWGVGGKLGDMAVSEALFESNLKKWEAWNSTKMVITKGYFSDTLPVSKVEHISFLRLDGDIFVSTWDALEHLYHKVIPGGLIYIDDFGSFEGCREAVNKFRSKYKVCHFYNSHTQQQHLTIYLSLSLSGAYVT